MTLTLTAGGEFAPQPRTRVTIASNAAGPLPVPNNSLVTVWRAHADGTNHRVVSVTRDRLIGGSATVFDYHAPFGVRVTYTAVANGQVSAGAPLTGASAKPWLVHPAQPELSVCPIYIDGLGDDKRPARVGTYQVHNSEFPVTRSAGRRGAPESEIRVGVTPAQLAAVDALIADSGVLLINNPPRPGWDVTWRWVQPLDVTYQNPGKNDNTGGSASWPYRIMVIPYRSVGDPTTDIVPIWTIADEVAEFATITAAMAVFTTCGGQATNTRGT